ncbi:MAG: preprotein translocase subunit YajC [Oscillospiraceae bacterium]|nr:preprotein translocase subunit YajC [Oscillospiraceae bacterium]
MTPEGGIISMLTMFLPIILMVVVMYFLILRPQRKKEKETQKMRSNMQIGDEVVTIGGIIGRVVSMKEDTIVIETGSDRSKIRILRTAVNQNNTIHDDVEG